MYKKKQPKPPPSAKNKAKTAQLVNDLAALFDTASDQPNAARDKGKGTDTESMLHAM
jgi:hypothetical protein